jgi:hypothetical protein
MCLVIGMLLVLSANTAIATIGAAEGAFSTFSLWADVQECVGLALVMGLVEVGSAASASVATIEEEQPRAVSSFNSAEEKICNCSINSWVLRDGRRWDCTRSVESDRSRTWT